MQRKVLYLQSTASKGPYVPIVGDYTITVEGGEFEEIAVQEANGYLQVFRLHGDQPLTVYADFE
jgi:hypothetical protein